MNWAAQAAAHASWMLVVTDPQYRILWLNNAAQRAFGADNQFTGRYCYEAIEGRDDICPHCIVAQGHAAGKDAEGEIQEIGEDGRKRSFHVRAVPIRDDNDQIVAWVECTTSITSRKLLALEADRLQSQLTTREMQARFASLVDVLPVGIGIFVDGQTTWANPQFAQLFGYDADEILGLPPSDMVPPETRERVYAAFERILADRSRLSAADVEIVDRHGQRRLLSVLSTYCVYNGHDAVMVTTQDVTEEREIEAKIRKSNRELAAFNSIAAMLGRTLELSDVLGVALDEMISITEADAAAISFVNWEKETLDLAAHRKMPSILFPRLRSVSLRRSWNEDVCRKGELLIIDDAFHMPTAFQETKRAGLHAFACVPLKCRDEVVGVLDLAARQPGHFNAVSSEFLLSIGAQIGMAIRNAQLFKGKAESEQVYRTLFETVPDVIVVISISTQKFVTYNQPFRQLLGYTDEELAQMDVRDIVLPEHYEAGKHLLRAFMKEGATGPVRLELRCRRKNGDVRVLDTSSSPYYIQGRLMGMLVVARDVTEQQQLQQHMIRTEKMSALGQLVSGVAHELNNPLATILLTTEMLAQKETDLDKQSKLQAIIEQVQRGSSLTEDLRLFARREDPKRDLVDLANIVQRVNSLVAPAFKQAGAEVCFEIPTTIPSVEGDEHQLEQVFLNLMTNAHQALEDHPGERRLTVSITTDAAQSDTPPQRVCVRFSDTGPGLPPEVRHRIFDPFYTTKPPGKGTGLGLSVSLGIVERHGGTIQLDPISKGGCFIVELPTAEATDTDISVGGTAPTMPVSDLGGLRVLIIEREHEMSQILAEMLERANCTVSNAKDLTGALASMGNESYDAVLCSLDIPGMDSIAYIEAVRRDRPALAARTIFMSGGNRWSVTDASAEEHSNAILEKPFTYAELMQALGEMKRING